MTPAKWLYLTTMTMLCGLIAFSILIIDELVQQYWNKRHAGGGAKHGR